MLCKPTNYKNIFEYLKSLRNPTNIKGMARFGINTKNTLGINIPILRRLAKEIRKSSSINNSEDTHTIALKLWSSGIHEARILASMIDKTEKVSEAQMDSWIKDFDSWDICDQVCMNLFDKTPYAFKKAIEWTKHKKEFEKRAGFTLMACLAWHDKTAPDKKFIQFFPYIKTGAVDERNFVKKSVNWALRQIGKRNRNLNKKAIQIVKEIEKIEGNSAKWIAKDAKKELIDKKF